MIIAAAAIAIAVGIAESRLCRGRYGAGNITKID